jgi:(5-formylfuran-3-yl)methyl phosphate synthase
MAELLVSVRSPAEAEVALAGGAALIDVKEPDRGSLGRASDATIAAVCERVAGRRPVSAALGELRAAPTVPAVGLAYAKWGLSGCLGRPGWQLRLAEAGGTLRCAVRGAQPVAVSYADWQQARAPQPEDVAAFACEQRWGVFLLDTWVKNGATLLDWLTPRAIDRLCRLCRTAGVRVALAGALGLEHMRRLQAVEPDWFAVRGAVCRRHCRTEAIDMHRVRELVQCLHQAAQGRLRTACPRPWP